MGTASCIGNSLYSQIEMICVYLGVDPTVLKCSRLQFYYMDNYTNPESTFYMTLVKTLEDSVDFLDSSFLH